MVQRKRQQKDGANRLEEALAHLIQSQAASVAQQTAFLARLSETDKEVAVLRRQTDERFARIEAILSQLIHLVHELPEAVKDKVGFKPKE